MDTRRTDQGYFVKGQETVVKLLLMMLISINFPEKLSNEREE